MCNVLVSYIIVICNNFREARHRRRIRINFLESGKYLVFLCGDERDRILFVISSCILQFIRGYAVAQLFVTLRYKPEGRGFDSRCHSNFSLT